MSQGTESLSRPGITTLVPPNQWIIGVRADLAFFLLTPLALVAAVAVAQRFWSMTALGVFATVLAMGHYLPGLMRAYGDPELFQRFRWRFILAPIFFITVSLVMAIHEYYAFLIVVVLWGSWHWLMQTYGLVRIYDAKASNFDALSARFDYALCILWFGVIYWQTDGAATVLMRFYQTGAYIPPEVFVWFVRGWAIATAAVTVIYFGYIWKQIRAGHPPSILKLILLAITAAYYTYAFGFTSSYIVAYTLFEGYHDIQYLAIVWIFNRNRAERSQHAGSFTRFLFRQRAPLIGLYVLLCLGFGSYRYFADRIADEQMGRLALGLVTGFALLHFYFDGFIWRIREPSTSATLDLTNQTLGQRIRSFSLSRGQRHALLWIALSLPVLALAIMESRGRSEINEERAYQAVLSIRPNSHKAHFMISQYYARQGQRKKALEHAAIARRIRPHYDLYDVQYADLLMEEFDQLTEEQLTEIAACYANAAKTRPDLPHLFENWSIVLQKLGNLEMAEQILRTAVARNPENAELNLHLAQLLAKRQKFQEAVEACETALRHDSRLADAHHLLAMLYMQLGRPDYAFGHFEQAIALKPDNKKFRADFALALASVNGPLRDLSRAVAIANELAETIGTKDGDIALNLCQVYALNGDFTRARELANMMSNQFKREGAEQLADQWRSIARQLIDTAKETNGTFSAVPN